MAGGVEIGQRGSDGDGFAGADLAGDHADGGFVDAPGDAGDGFGVAGVAVQHGWGQVFGEGRAGETPVGAQTVRCSSAASSLSSSVVSGCGCASVSAVRADAFQSAPGSNGWSASLIPA